MVIVLPFPGCNRPGYLYLLSRTGTHPDTAAASSALSETLLQGLSGPGSCATGTPCPLDHGHQPGAAFQARRGVAVGEEEEEEEEDGVAVGESKALGFFQRA
jgi:hypothetical protein